MAYHDPYNCQTSFEELSQVLSGFIHTYQCNNLIFQLDNCIQSRVNSTMTQYHGAWDNSHLIAINHLIDLYMYIQQSIDNFRQNNQIKISWDHGFWISAQGQQWQVTRNNLRPYNPHYIKYFKYKNKYFNLKYNK